MATISLDRHALAHARAIVALESPTRAQETRFHWAARLLAATFVLSIGWIVAALADYDGQQWLLIAAELTCVAGLLLFAWSSPFAIRALRSIRLAKKLGLRWRWSNQPGEWAWILFLSTLHFVGWFICVLGIAGLFVEAEQQDDLLLAVAVFSFGVSLVALWPIELLRKRIRALVPLRDALDAPVPNATTLEVPTKIYDGITALEFERNFVDSHRALKNASSRQSESALAIRLTQPFREAVAGVPVSQADEIYEAIGRFGGRSQKVARDRDEFTLPIPDTAFEVGLRWQRERNEIEVLSLSKVSNGA